MAFKSPMLSCDVHTPDWKVGYIGNIDVESNII